MVKYVEQDGRRKSGGWDAGLKKRIWREGFFVVLDWIAREYLKVAGPIWKIQSPSKLQKVRKWQAEIQDKQLGLTGIGTLNPKP